MCNKTVKLMIETGTQLKFEAIGKEKFDCVNAP